MSRPGDGRRANRRVFRPEGDGLVLESRRLLAATVIHLAYGGQISEIRTPDYARYNVILTGGGVVRAQAMKGGKVKLIVQGSLATSSLTINPLSNAPTEKGLAHTFPVHQAKQSHQLQVGEIDITSGQIGSILGYSTAILSGPINIPGTTAVDRIAFYAYEPGASITTGGDLNTLDAYTSINLAGGPGISVGRDLNFLNVASDLNLSGGSSILVNRDLGLSAQPAKGTDTGGQGAVIGGNVNIGVGSTLTVNRSLQALFLVNGNYSGASRTLVSFDATNFTVRGSITP